jgi:hypothetical protein
MRIALVNTFFPPDTAITGRALAELAKVVASRPGVELRVFASDQKYLAGSKLEINEFDVVRLAYSSYRNNRIFRLLSSIWFGCQLARNAVTWADVVISMTDPPLLGYWIGRKVKRSNRTVGWIEWTMDLYPEAFAAAGIVSTSNPAYRYFARALSLSKPDAFVCLGPKQAEEVGRLRGQAGRLFTLPCGVVATGVSEQIPAWRVGEKKIILAYGGNLGEAHSVPFLVDLVESADPEIFRFRFAVYGKHAESLKARLSQNPAVDWVDKLTAIDLVHCDVHLASLLPRWASVCVPSKAVTSVCHGRPLIFAGSKDMDNHVLLRDAMWFIPCDDQGKCSPDDIRKVLAEISTPVFLQTKTNNAIRLAEEISNNHSNVLEEIADYACGLAHEGTKPL